MTSDRRSFRAPNPADRVGSFLADLGFRHLFGVPGGGYSSDVVVAAGAHGVRFVLSQTETGAALMAAAQAEITERPGACITTLGPGLTSVVNGAAHALLDRVPLLVLADAPPGPVGGIGIHQRVDQRMVLKPVTKGQARVGRDRVEETLAWAVDLATAAPAGPVYVELGFAGSVDDKGPEAERSGPSSAEDGVTNSASWGALRAMIAVSRRPLALVGLEVRAPDDVAAVREFCRASRVPALVTYKAKGVIPDSSPQFAGVLTNGAIETSVLEGADLLIGVGLDPIELLPRPWPFTTPMIDVSSIEHAADVLPIRGRVGDGLVDGLHRVASAFGSTEGAERANAEAKRACELVAALGSGRLTPTTAISELVARWAPDVRVTVDAGAHMLPAMQLWPAEARGDLLISNGLATMGFALPAAIGAALLESGRRVVALTGDGGLLMCLGELATLARENLDVCVVVFDDRTLSLIKLKQEQRGEAAGVALGPVDWVTMASSLGIRGYAADSMEGLRARIADIGSKPGPSLLAIRVESFDYVPVLQAIRG